MNLYHLILTLYAIFIASVFYFGWTYYSGLTEPDGVKRFFETLLPTFFYFLVGTMVVVFGFRIFMIAMFPPILFFGMLLSGAYAGFNYGSDASWVDIFYYGYILSLLFGLINLFSDGTFDGEHPLWVAWYGATFSFFLYLLHHKNPEAILQTTEFVRSLFS